MDSLIKKIGLLLLILALLSFTSIIVAVVLSFSSSSPLVSGNVAVIPINGVISNTEDYWSGETTNPETVRQWIEDANADDTIKVVVFEISSPGGSAVASDEIGQAIKRLNKTSVSWIRDIGASGGYWVASNTDHIIANRMSITGSVGVTASYIEFAGTLRRFNATYQQLTGGEYKELGNPFDELSEEEREILQMKIDGIHWYFLEEVQQNRNLTNETMKFIATGEFFLGYEAYELGLVDELGGYYELDAYVRMLLGEEEPSYVYYERPTTFFEDLGLVKTSIFPQSKLQIQT